MTTATMVDDRVRELFFRYDPTTPLEPEQQVLSEEVGVRTTHDETVPPAAGQALFDALGEPKRIAWFDGGRTDLTGREFKEFWACLSESL